MQDEQLRGEVAHPDADLLTAFAEQALPARERDQVLAHLARCADCREVAALAGAATSDPELAAATVRGRPAAGKAEKSFWSWGPLRWTAAAATAAVVLSAVWLNRPPQTQLIAPPAPVATLQNSPRSDASVPLENAPDKGPLTPDGRTQIEFVKSKNAPASLPDRPASPAAEDRAANELVGKKQDQVAAKGETSDDQVESLQTANKPASQSYGGPIRMAGGALKAKSVPLEERVAGNNVTAATAPASVRPAPEVTMSFSRQAAAELAPADQVAESQAQSAEPRRDAQSQVRVGPMATPLPTDQASLDSLQKSLASHSSGVLWRVSSSGELQQSTDSGHNWRTALGEHPSKFRSVASAGAIVWAGGDDGALWSSLNNGVTWRKSAPSVDGHSPRGNVENIRLAAPKNVTFRTSAGETWSSSDGGTSWTVKYE